MIPGPIFFGEFNALFHEVIMEVIEYCLIRDTALGQVRVACRKVVSGITVHKDHNWITLAVLTTACEIRFLGISTSFVRNDHLAAIQPVSGNSDALLQQTARVLAQVED